MEYELEGFIQSITHVLFPSTVTKSPHVSDGAETKHCSFSQPGFTRSCIEQSIPLIFQDIVLSHQECGVVITAEQHNLIQDTMEGKAYVKKKKKVRDSKKKYEVINTMHKIEKIQMKN